MRSKYEDLSLAVSAFGRNQFVGLTEAQKGFLVSSGVKVMLQGMRSIGAADSVCVYRGASDDGKPLCCAVGYLISEEQYTENLESKGAASFLVIEAIAKTIGEEHVTAEFIFALKKMQTSHDSTDTKSIEVPNAVLQKIKELGVFDNNTFRTTFVTLIGAEFAIIYPNLFVDILTEYNKQGRLPAETTGENNV